MKILEIIEGSGWCGTKEQTYLITKGLSKYYDVELALAFSHYEMIERLKDKVVLRFYEERKRLNIGNYIRLFKIIEEGNYDVIIPNSSLSFNYIVFIYPFLNKKPKIIALRRSSHIPSFISKHIKYRIAKRIVVVSQKVFEALKRHNFFPKKLVVIESGIELERFKPSLEYRKIVRKELGIKENEKVFINIANYQPEVKGQDILLKAFKRIDGNCKLILAGHQTDSHKAKSLIERLGIKDRVLTLGFRNDVERLLQASDYFVLSSNLEGIGGSLLQAMASGKVVLSTLAGGISGYLKDGENGFTCPCKDIDSLYKKMKNMLSLSSWEYKNLSKKAQVTAQKYSIEKTIEKWRNLIEEINDNL